jgi:hypothetical protein
MGYNQYLATGEETTWGTAVTRNKFAKTFEGSSLEHKVERAYSGANAGNTGADPEFIYEKAQWAEGTIVMPVAYDDACIMRLLKHGIGGVATSGSGPYLHTFTRGNTGDVFAGLNQAAATSLSLELNSELPDTALAARLMKGAAVTSIGLSLEAQGEFTATFGVMGLEAKQAAKSASPTYPNYDLYLSKWTQATLSVGGTDRTTVVKGFSLDLQNNYEKVICWGSSNTKRPRRVGKSSISGSFTLSWESSASAVKAIIDSYYLSQTACPLILTVQGPTGYSWTMNLTKAFVVNSEMDSPEGQLQSNKFDFLCGNDATDTALKLVVSNQSLATAL